MPETLNQIKSKDIRTVASWDLARIHEEYRKKVNANALHTLEDCGAENPHNAINDFPALAAINNGKFKFIVGTDFHIIDDVLDTVSKSGGFFCVQEEGLRIYDMVKKDDVDCHKGHPLRVTSLGYVSMEQDEHEDELEREDSLDSWHRMTQASQQLIKIAYENPKLRSALLPIILGKKVNHKKASSPDAVKKARDYVEQRAEDYYNHQGHHEPFDIDGGDPIEVMHKGKKIYFYIVGENASHYFYLGYDDAGNLWRTASSPQGEYHYDDSETPDENGEKYKKDEHGEPIILDSNQQIEHYVEPYDKETTTYMGHY